MQSYEKLLDKAYDELPATAKEVSRFKMPEFDVFIQGTQTIINNFTEVAGILRREPDHLMKYLLKECATAGSMQKNKLVMKGRVKAVQLNEKLNAYAKEFVLCSECKKPDTNLVMIDGVLYKRCEACAARHPVIVIR